MLEIQSIHAWSLKKKRKKLKIGSKNHGYNKEGSGVALDDLEDFSEAAMPGFSWSLGWEQESSHWRVDIEHTGVSV